MCDGRNYFFIFAGPPSRLLWRWLSWHWPQIFCAVLPEVFATLSHSTQEALAERFLWSILIVYWVSLGLAVIGGGVLTIVIVRARRNGIGQPTAARLLLLCESSLLCIGILEAAGAALAGIGAPISQLADAVYGLATATSSTSL